MMNPNKIQIEQTLSQTSKIRTGQPFLYRNGGLESQVLEICMKEPINGSTMSSALSKTLRRYPYFTSRLAEVKGDFFPAKNTLPMVLRHGKNLLPLGGKETNYHLLDLNYDGKTLFISYFHGLCDGRGIMPFARTLLYYYFSLEHAKIMKVPNIQRATDPMQEGEEMEPGFVSLDVASSSGMPKIQRQGYAIPEAVCQKARASESFRYEIRIDAKTFMEYAKSVSATPAIAVALLFSSMLREVRGSDNDEPIICNLVTDLRSGIGLENTYRNCVSSVELLLTNEESGLFFSDLAVKYREIIREYRKPENIQREFQKIIRLSDKLDALPSFEEKQQALSFFDTLLSNTYVLSYIGRTSFGDCEDHIEEIHTYSSGSPGLSMEMLATEDYFFIDLMQSFQDDKYAFAFADMLLRQGIDAKMSGAILYSTPKDKVREC